MTLNNWVKVNLWQWISGEPFNLQPSNLAQGDRFACSASPLVLNDLDLIVQFKGQTCVGYILRRIYLQPSYLAQGDKLASTWSPLILSDLDLIVQGQFLVGDIWRTVWPTTFIFGTGGQVGKPFKSINFGWPWPNCSRSIFGRWYLENCLTNQHHIWHGGRVQVSKSFKFIHFEWPWPNCSRSASSIFVSDILRTVWPTTFIVPQGDKLTSPSSPIILSDLEQLGQGQSLLGVITF